MKCVINFCKVLLFHILYDTFIVTLFLMNSKNYRSDEPENLTDIYLRLHLQCSWVYRTFPQ